MERQKSAVQSLPPEWWIVLLVPVVGLTAGCLSKRVECDDDGACQSDYGSHYVCASDGICERSSCKSDRKCQRSFGPNYTCDSDRRCGQIPESEYLAEPCDAGTEGPVFEKGTYNAGVIMDLSDEGLIGPIADSVRMAHGDVNDVSGIEGHSLGLVLCDTRGETSRAVEAAKHLSEIGIQAVVGPDYSSYAPEVLSKALVPNQILSVSPSATTTAINSISDEGLFWRTAPNDEIQAEIMANLAKGIRSRHFDSSEEPIAVLARKGDTYSEGLRNGITKTFSVEMTESDRFLTLDYPNSSRKEDVDYGEAVEKVANHDPGIVVILGLSETWELIRLIEGRLSERESGDRKTIYLLPDGGKNSDAAQSALQEFPDLVGRVWGTSPTPPNPDQYAPYKSFKVRWQSRYSTNADSHPFVSNGYDAMFLIAFASAAAQSFSGPALGKGMKKLTDPNGKTVTASSEDAQKGFKLLGEGKTIDFNGVSGPLDFDSNGDPKTSTIGLWCLKENGLADTAKLTKVDSGEFEYATCGGGQKEDSGD